LEACNTNRNDFFRILLGRGDNDKMAAAILQHRGLVEELDREEVKLILEFTPQLQITYRMLELFAWAGSWTILKLLLKHNAPPAGPDQPQYLVLDDKEENVLEVLSSRIGKQISPQQLLEPAVSRCCLYSTRIGSLERKNDYYKTVTTLISIGATLTQDIVMLAAQQGEPGLVDFLCQHGGKIDHDVFISTLFNNNDCFEKKDYEALLGRLGAQPEEWWKGLILEVCTCSWNFAEALPPLISQLSMPVVWDEHFQENIKKTKSKMLSWPRLNLDRAIKILVDSGSTFSSKEYMIEWALSTYLFDRPLLDIL
jgi:hypothetical protein